MGDLFSSETELVGDVREVVFENAENGYAVIRLEVSGQPRPVTVTGALYGLHAGARVKVFGEFREHPRFGRQLVAKRHEEVLPRSHVGMVAFLASQFHGIGVKLAERIVERFGDQTYEILDHDPTLIGTIPGVGRKKAAAVAAQWESRKAIREAATFLQGYGVGPGQVARVFRHYGDATVALVKTNPYRLADEVRGIGFKTADKIAQSLGIPKDSPERARAAVLYLLGEAAGQGHLLLPMAELRGRALALEIEEEALSAALVALAGEELVVVENEAPASGGRRVVPSEGVPGERGFWDRAGPAVYALANHRDEAAVAWMLSWRGVHQDAEIGLVERVRAAARRAGIELAPEQEEAVRRAFTSRLGVITGGPGVGKTTIIKLLVDLAEQRGDEVKLAAPTGRAAKRLSEATGRPASTIHRLLGFDPFTFEFFHGSENPISAGHLVLDECSMLDVPLAAALLRAVPEDCRLTLVGDADQLPSVGPGDFFRAVCASDAVPVSRLTRVFRQREGSHIVAGAHAVNRGEFPDFDPPGPGGEFYFVQQDSPEETAEMIRTLVVERMPQAYGLDPRLDIQVLTPMHKGAAGAENLNAVLGQALNPNPESQVVRGGRTLRTGDRVVQIRNDYEKNVFNGDQGFVVAADGEKGTLVVRIDDREVRYERDDLEMLLPAWATTVHRAQGGEYRAVVLALTGQHFPLLRRNLAYTAITRARALCVIVGSRRALALAIRNGSTSDRCSWLEERLRAARAPSEAGS
ncbi:MAG: ATP-dependent RecD-like DNA helicase [Planctomycetes bacterium]|nr:ATP-dependent RecD-like DNA helicase [Planctomycetota bacterium]